ncbi:DNA adenine methylase [Mesoplasma lactucae]|uniref:Site-specific DNA-methyltransferase (adenine-specific) n=1 Tax=Mesoplasma lactucae ATCC 49193 TaxID=81460 RepID=A0A291IR04_9MOLU|nr:DNA adenine methylase [Mesoplasma lactucae]ATG97164.1 modification methylase [Mesoplasma lactucae ATCC 49193]ATZ20396.1 restriction endonuclease subunit M [Mesoplasma lactucae ATCC 49193]MCL8216567.1 Modification methylase DpnIIA [Mesoplasma lactucae ATCC 49193]
MKPFVKWAGGKSKLVDEIKSRIPKDTKRLVEPFVGGGALFLSLEMPNSLINDNNKELINLYKTIRNNPKKLMNNVDKLAIEYNKSPEEFYYYLRNLDKADVIYKSFNPTFRASRVLFLNKTDFNGLYRVNANNKFNVPWGRKEKAPEIYDKKNIDEISDFLKTTTIVSKDYRKLQKDIKAGDFVYIDPPYDKLKEDTFTTYTKDDFDRANQVELKEFCDELNKKGIKFLVSNHNTEFIRDLYRDYNISIVMMARNINSNGQKRNAVEEVLISNY